MLYRALVIAAVICWNSVGLSAQESGADPPMSVYAELLGPSEFASLNVDRLFSDVWLARVGFQAAGSGRSLGEHYVQIPASLSYLRFFGPLGLEAGAGVVATINPQYDWDTLEYFVGAGARTRPLYRVFLRGEVLALPTEEGKKQFGVGIGLAF